jgi:hypothetical protein
LGWQDARLRFSELLRTSAEARLQAINLVAAGSSGPVSHRLRTQLHAIIGHAELIVADAPEGDTREGAQLIAVSAERLFRLLQDQRPGHDPGSQLRCARHYGVALRILRRVSDESRPPIDMTRVNVEFGKTLASLLKTAGILSMQLSAGMQGDQLRLCVVCSYRSPSWKPCFPASVFEGTHDSLDAYKQYGRWWVVHSFGTSREHVAIGPFRKEIQGFDYHE